jgi:hypothetical protein
MAANRDRAAVQAMQEQQLTESMQRVSSLHGADYAAAFERKPLSRLEQVDRPDSEISPWQSG